MKVVGLETELSLEEGQEQLEAVPIRRDGAGANPDRSPVACAPDSLARVGRKSVARRGFAPTRPLEDGLRPISGRSSRLP